MAQHGPSFLIRFFNADEIEVGVDYKLKDAFTEFTKTYVVDNSGESFTVNFPNYEFTESTMFDIKPCNFNINTKDTGLLAQSLGTDVTSIPRPPGVGLEKSAKGKNRNYSGYITDLITEYLELEHSKNVFKGFFFSDPDLIKPSRTFNNPNSGFFEFPNGAEYVFFAILNNIELQKYTPNKDENSIIDDANFKALRERNFAEKLQKQDGAALRTTTADDLNFIKTIGECITGERVENGSNTVSETQNKCIIEEHGKINPNKINVLTLGKHMPVQNNNEINFAGTFSIKGYLIKKPPPPLYFNRKFLENFKMLLYLIQLGFFIENRDATRIIKSEVVSEAIRTNIQKTMERYGIWKGIDLEKIRKKLNEYGIELNNYINTLEAKQAEINIAANQKRLTDAAAASTLEKRTNNKLKIKLFIRAKELKDNTTEEYKKLSDEINKWLNTVPKPNNDQLKYKNIIKRIYKKIDIEWEPDSGREKPVRTKINLKELQKQFWQYAAEFHKLKGAVSYSGAHGSVSYSGPQQTNADRSAKNQPSVVAMNTNPGARATPSRGHVMAMNTSLRASAATIPKTNAGRSTKKQSSVVAMNTSPGARATPSRGRVAMNTSLGASAVTTPTGATSMPINRNTSRKGKQGVKRTSRNHSSSSNKRSTRKNEYEKKPRTMRPQNT